MEISELIKRVLKIIRLGALFRLIARPFISRERLPSSTEARAALNEWSPDPDRSSFISAANHEPTCDLSIIIPAFNVERYIADCLMSIFSQQVSEGEIEVIVVNDGSTDRTPQLLDSLAGRHPITVIHQDNAGFSGARNTGLDRARGRYIMFLDSDDFLLPDSIDLLLRKARETGADIVEGGFFSFCKGHPWRKYHIYAEAEKVAATSLRGMPWGKVIRSELFQNLRFPLNYWFEDSIIAYVVYLMAGRAATISAVVYAYRKNPAGITRTAISRPKCVDTFWIFERLMKDLPSFSIQPSQGLYEQVLRQVDLNYERTRRMPDLIKQAIFVLSADLLDDRFPDYVTISTGKYRKLQDALRNRNYQDYRLVAAWLN